MLNKKGWGLKEMLLLSGLLVIFLFIAIFYIYILYANFDKDVINKQYDNLENKLKNATEVYLDKYYEDTLTNDYVTISLKVLRAYGLDVALYDYNGDPCNGYVRVNKSKAIVNIEPYISCEKYETSGYESWRE